MLICIEFLSLQMSFHMDSYWQIIIAIYDFMILIEHINYLECIFRILLCFIAFLHVIILQNDPFQLKIWWKLLSYS